MDILQYIEKYKHFFALYFTVYSHIFSFRMGAHRLLMAPNIVSLNYVSIFCILNIPSNVYNMHNIVEYTPYLFILEYCLFQNVPHIISGNFIFSQPR